MRAPGPHEVLVADGRGTGAFLAWVRDVARRLAGMPRQEIGSAAPAAGAWGVGDVVWNDAPAPGGPIGWVCTEDGEPGEWRAWGVIAA